jgi:hypothetical protein
LENKRLATTCACNASPAQSGVANRDDVADEVRLRHQRLTSRACVRPTLRHYAPFNDGSTVVTRFAVTTKHAESGLMGTRLAIGVAVIRKSRAAVSDGFRENCRNRKGNPLHGIPSNVAPSGRWVNFSHEQYFIDINVSQASDDALVEQYPFDWRAPVREGARKVVDAQ